MELFINRNEPKSEYILLNLNSLQYDPPDFVVDLLRDDFLKKCVQLIFTFLILIRLFIIVNPFFFYIINSILINFLIFNKFLVITYSISLILIISRITLYLTERNMRELKREISFLNYKTDLTLPYMQIKPTWKNATVITLWICYSIMRNGKLILHLKR